MTTVITVAVSVGVIILTTIMITIHRPLGFGFPPCTAENCKTCDFKDDCEFKEDTE